MSMRASVSFSHNRGIPSVRICNPHKANGISGFAIRCKIQFQIVGQCPRGNYLLRDCKSRIMPCADCKSAQTFDCLQTRQITIVH